jgi:hypothetical protein
MGGPKWVKQELDLLYFAALNASIKDPKSTLNIYIISNYSLNSEQTKSISIRSNHSHIVYSNKTMVTEPPNS